MQHLPLMKSSVQTVVPVRSTLESSSNLCKIQSFHRGSSRRLPQDAYTEIQASSKFHVTNSLRIFAQHILTLRIQN